MVGMIGWKDKQGGDEGGSRETSSNDTRPVNM